MDHMVVLVDRLISQELREVLKTVTVRTIGCRRRSSLPMELDDVGKAIDWHWILINALP
jgi:hypothetical protein